SVQAVQIVQAVQTPSFILPRDAGEDRGRGLNRAPRLNGLNVWNTRLFRSFCSEYDHRSDLHEIAPRLRDAALGLTGILACACFAAQLPKKLAEFHHARCGDGVSHSEEAARWRCRQVAIAIKDAVGE